MALSLSNNPRHATSSRASKKMSFFGFSITFPLPESHIGYETFREFAVRYGIPLPSMINDVNFPRAAFNRWLRDRVRYSLQGILFMHNIRRCWVWPMTTNGKLELCFLGSTYMPFEANQLRDLQRKLFPGEPMSLVKNFRQAEMYRKLRVYLRRITKAQFNKFNVIVGNKVPVE